jgi:hypothetical protein
MTFSLHNVFAVTVVTFCWILVFVAFSYLLYG